MCWSMFCVGWSKDASRVMRFFFTAAPTFGHADGTPWSRATVTDSGHWSDWTVVSGYRDTRLSKVRVSHTLTKE